VKENEGVPNASEICKVLKEIADTLNYPRRIKILNAIPPGSEKTFKELEEATEISASSLHSHLKEMWRAGFIDKSDERPAKYKRSGFLNSFISLITQEQRCTGIQLSNQMRLHGHQQIQAIKVGEDSDDS